MIRAVAFEDFAALPTDQAEHLVRYAQAVSSQTADQIVHLCWAHSTPRAIVSAYESVRSLALTESDAIGEPLPAFQGKTRWSRTATDKNTGSEGTPVTLRWSFVPDGTTILDSRFGRGSSNLIEKLNDAYGSPTTAGDLTTAPWFRFFDDAFKSWAKVTGNIYIYESNDDGTSIPDFQGGIINTRGDIRIGGFRLDGDNGTLGINYFPNIGDMVIDSDDTSILRVGNEALFQNLISHEHGHGLALSHVCPINDTKLMESLISSVFAGPQIDDIVTVQGLYGDRLERGANSKNNNTIATASDLGTLNSGYTASAISISNSNDIDIFSFEIDSPRELNVSVTPTSAAAYLEGAENNDGSCSAGTLFDPQTRQDLSIRVLAPNGSIVLGSSNSAEIGQAETLDSIKLIETNQRYYIEVTGGGENSADVNNAQLYSLEIELADLRAVIPKDFIITNESCSPANDSPDPDERITSSITVENLDSETATNVSITLSGSSNLSIQGNATQNIGTLTPGQTMDVVYTFSLSGNCADAESITFRVDTATDFVEHTEAFTLGTNQIISSENFDSTPLDQIPTGYSQDFGNRGTNWRTTAASAASAPNSVFAPRHTTVNSSYLISPEITVNNHSFELRFDHDHNTEDLFDGGILEISINDGTWTEWIAAGGSFAKNGSNREINSEWRSPIGGQNAWSGDSGGFIQTIANFPPSAIGQTVRVRWHLASDQLNFETISEGWWIDNVEIYGLVCCETMIPTLSVTAPSPTVAEFTPATTTDFIISSDMAVSGDLSVAYTLSGSATADSDFVALAGTASILDSQSMVAIPVTAITDSMIEGDERITLTISPSDNYGIDTAVASITIKDLPFDAFRHEISAVPRQKLQRRRTSIPTVFSTSSNMRSALIRPLHRHFRSACWSKVATNQL